MRMRLDHTAHATGCTFYACIRTHAHTCNRLYIQCTHLSQIHPTNPASKSLNHSSDARRTTFHLTPVAGSNSKVAQDKSLDSSQLFSEFRFTCVHSLGMWSGFNPVKFCKILLSSPGFGCRIFEN